MKIKIVYEFDAFPPKELDGIFEKGKKTCSAIQRSRIKPPFFLMLCGGWLSIGLRKTGRRKNKKSPPQSSGVLKISP
jgi:hypothetical protein